MILFNPGPVVLSTKVREALTSEDICHREQEFFDLQNHLRSELLKVYDLDPQEWTAILVAGSGTSGVEAMITGLLPDEGTLLSVENGVYGERITKIAECNNIPVKRLTFEWTSPIDTRDFENTLAENPKITHVSAIHHETTSGRLNDIQALTEICERNQVTLLLDGVSSFGAEDICFESKALGACAATANKCLHGAPGLSFVMVKRSALDHEPSPRSVYLNLHSYYKAQEKNATPFTMPIHLFYALKAALEELSEKGGYRERQNSYRHRSTHLLESMKNLGIETLIAEEDSSLVLRAFKIPEKLNYDQLHDHLKSRGFVIYSGQGDLAKSIFRLSPMGQVEDRDLENFKTAIQELL